MSAAPRLLWITDRRRAPTGLAELAGRLVRAGVRGVQVREGDLADGDLFELVSAVLRAVADSPAVVLVNDRVDVALATGAGGVHLKSDGLSPRVARELARDRLGEGATAFLVGRACHSGAEVAAAAREGADYVTLSPLVSGSGRPPLGREGFRRELEEARRLAAPSTLPAWLALGGVDVEVAPFLASIAAPGEAWGLAAISALQQPPDGRRPEDAAAELSRALLLKA